MPRRALLLAGGLGTRLRPVTDVLPKCLVPICGRPLLGYWLDALCGAGFDRIVVNLHHHAGLVREYVERGPHSKKLVLVHEKELLGTGGTLLANRKLLEGGPVLVAHADNFSVFDPNELLARHRDRPDGCIATLMTFRTAHPQACGIVEMDGNGVLRAFHEKVPDPPGTTANAAVYVFDGAVFDMLEEIGRRAIDLSTEVLPRLIGRALCVENNALHRDIGTLQSLSCAQFEAALLHPEVIARDVDNSWLALLRSGSPPLGQRLAAAIVAALDGPR